MNGLPIRDKRKNPWILQSYKWNAICRRRHRHLPIYNRQWQPLYHIAIWHTSQLFCASRPISKPCAYYYRVYLYLYTPLTWTQPSTHILRHGPATHFRTQRAPHCALRIVFQEKEKFNTVRLRCTQIWRRCLRSGTLKEIQHILLLYIRRVRGIGHSLTIGLLRGPGPPGFTEK